MRGSTVKSKTFILAKVETSSFKKKLVQLYSCKCFRPYGIAVTVLVSSITIGVISDQILL